MPYGGCNKTVMRTLSEMDGATEGTRLPGLALTL